MQLQILRGVILRGTKRCDSYWLKQWWNTIHIPSTVHYNMASPDTSDAVLLYVSPVGRGSGKGPFGASLAPPTPPPLQESSHTWMELHVTPHMGSLMQPDSGRGNIKLNTCLYIYRKDYHDLCYFTKIGIFYHILLCYYYFIIIKSEIWHKLWKIINENKIWTDYFLS